MTIEYDPSIDAAYVRFTGEIGPSGVARTVPVDPREIDGEINLDFDADGHLIGVEIQDASRFLPADLLERAANKSR